MATVIKQGDTAPIIDQRLHSDGDPIDLSNVNSVTFRMFDEYENKVVEDDDSGNVTIENAETGNVSYAWQPGDTSDVGEYQAEWTVEYSDGTTITAPNDRFIDVVVHE